MLQPQYRLEGIVHTRNEGMEDFEGPLDVIFLLLSKNKIEIQDVSISAILEQYLAYLEEMKRLDMEIASEFITMASHLMLIKTKMLLSKAEQEEAQSELDVLRQSLLERQRRKLLSRSAALWRFWSSATRSVAVFLPNSRSLCAGIVPIAIAMSRRIYFWRLKKLLSAASVCFRRLLPILRAL